MKWLDKSDINLLKDLSNNVYSRKKDSYPASLNASSPSQIFDLFLVPPEVIGSDQRRILGVFDEDHRLVMASGTRIVFGMPAWTLEWTLSEISSVSFVDVWKSHLAVLCSHYENIGYNEFYVISPVARERAYRHIMKPMRRRYWTFVETIIPRNQKAKHSLHWSLMSYGSYPYDINIRRYILKREETSDQLA